MHESHHQERGCYSCGSTGHRNGLIDWQRHAYEGQDGYIDAVMNEASQTDKQIALTPVTLGDPAFDATGLLRTDLVANRCASAMPVVRRFESQYVGVTAYKGHPVHDHSMAVAFALLARKRAFRQGCETKQQLQTARSGYRKIEAEDMVISTTSDILRHVIPNGWSHGPVTAAGVTAEIYADSFGDKK